MDKPKNPAAVALGRLGGASHKGRKFPRKGFAAMTPEVRKALQAKALETRRANAKNKSDISSLSS